MRVFVTKSFGRFARKERIADDVLIDAIERAEQGLIAGDLGGGLIKQRIARHGQGKREGFRTIIAYRQGSRAIFLYGFAKSERDNIDDDELAAWRATAKDVLSAAEARISRAIDDGELREVLDDQG